MAKPFNESLFNASLEALTERGVPDNIAIQASFIIVSDDPSAENLGRTQEDQAVINEAMKYCHEQNTK